MPSARTPTCPESHRPCACIRRYADIYDESAKLLYEEIDYTLEGVNGARFAKSLKDVGLDYVKVGGACACGMCMWHVACGMCMCMWPRLRQGAWGMCMWHVACGMCMRPRLLDLCGVACACGLDY